MVEKGDVSTAHNGFTDWYWQRLSAIVLLIILPLPFILLCSVYTGALDQFELLGILDHFVSRLLHTLLILAIIVHIYVGLKVIIEDYVHVASLRISLIGIMLVVMGGVGIWWLALIWAWAG